MTSEEIAARNRANAAKSTGPRTAAGKAVVARNARRHGATGRPDPESIATWLRVILDDPEISSEALLPGDDAGFRALALAEAEARVIRCEAALADWEKELADPDEVFMGYMASADRIRQEVRAGGGSPAQIRNAVAMLKLVARKKAHETKPGGWRHKLLQRYLREARAARRRAFDAWCLAGREERAEEGRDQAA